MKSNDKQLYIAIKKGQLDTVKYLKNAGIVFNANNYTALVIACKYGRYEICKYLLVYYSGNSDIPRFIVEACTYGHLKIVQYLFTYISPTLILEKSHISFLACKSGNLELVEYLRELGFDILSVKNVLRDVATEGHLSMVKYLLKNGAKLTTDVLIRSIIMGRYKVVKYLITHAHKYDVDFSNEIKTAFTHECNNLKIIKFLHEKGADINTKNSCILRYVSTQGNLEAVKYLVKNGAKIATNDNYASEESRKCIGEEISNYLLKQIEKEKEYNKSNMELDKPENNKNKSENKNNKNIEKKDAELSIQTLLLEKACRSGHHNIIKLLVTKGDMDISADNNHILTTCLVEKNFETAGFLIDEYGDIINKKGIHNTEK